MARAKPLQDIRPMKFDDVYTRRQAGKLTQEQAAGILGVSTRTMRRWEDRYGAEGADGLHGRRLGGISSNRVATDTVMKMLELFDSRYRDYTPKRFHGKLAAHHGFTQSYDRARRPMTGVMLHRDGSAHGWVPDKWWDPTVTMDDANNGLRSAFSVAEEGTMSGFQGLTEVIETHGPLCSLYADRGSRYWHTSEAGGKVDKDNLTRVGRALQQLRTEPIPSYPPQARGGSERMFGTLQNRLPQELRSRNTITIEEANQFPKDGFIPGHNAGFVKPAEATGSAFVPIMGNVRDTPCVREERVARNDSTVRCKVPVMQVAANGHRHHFIRAKARVREYPNGEPAIFHGPKRIGRHHSDGAPIKQREGPRKQAA